MLKRLVPAALLTAYSALLIRVMVFKDFPLIRIGHLMFNFGGADANGRANLIPFKTISMYLFGNMGWIIVGINLVGNVVVLMPIGFLLPLVFRGMTWKASLILSVVTALLIEGMQVVFQVGIFDIDDVILNALGVMLGYAVFILFLKCVRVLRH